MDDTKAKAFVWEVGKTTREQCSRAPGWCFYTEEYTTHLYGDCNNPI